PRLGGLPARPSADAALHPRSGAAGRRPALPERTAGQSLRPGVPGPAVPPEPAGPGLPVAGGARLAGARRLDLRGKRKRALDPRAAGQLAPAPGKARRAGALQPLAATGLTAHLLAQLAPGQVPQRPP